LMAAEAALAKARTQVTYAGKDNQGKAIYKPVNTSMYEVAVGNARYAVAQAQKHLSLCQEKLNRAIAERIAATARVDACESAVNCAAGAQSAATAALSQASTAVSFAARAEEEALQASHTLESAERAAALQSEKANIALIQSGHAVEHCDEASVEFAQAGRVADSAFALVHLARQDLGSRIDILHLYDS
jgi:hypothetical protein